MYIGIIRGFPKIRLPFLGGPHSKDYSIWGSTLGSPYFGKLPYEDHIGDNGREHGNYYGVSGLFRDNGKENGNYYSMLGLFRDDGKENGSYHLGILWEI